MRGGKAGAGGAEGPALGGAGLEDRWGRDPRARAKEPGPDPRETAAPPTTPATRLSSSSLSFPCGTAPVRGSWGSGSGAGNAGHVHTHSHVHTRVQTRASRGRTPPSEHACHVRAHPHANAHTELGVVSRAGRLQLRGVNTRSGTPGQERKRGPNSGVGGQGCPRMEVGTGRAGARRPPARAPSSAPGGTVVCVIALEVSCGCHQSAWHWAVPRYFQKHVAVGTRAAGLHPSCHPACSHPLGHAGRPVGPPAATLREGSWDGDRRVGPVFAPPRGCGSRAEAAGRSGPRRHRCCALGRRLLPCAPRAPGQPLPSRGEDTLLRGGRTAPRLIPAGDGAPKEGRSGEFRAAVPVDRFQGLRGLKCSRSRAQLHDPGRMGNQARGHGGPPGERHQPSLPTASQQAPGRWGGRRGPGEADHVEAERAAGHGRG